MVLGHTTSIESGRLRQWQFEAVEYFKDNTQVVRGSLLRCANVWVRGGQSDKHLKCVKIKFCLLKLVSHNLVAIVLDVFCNLLNAV